MLDGTVFSDTFSIFHNMLIWNQHILDIIFLGNCFCLFQVLHVMWHRYFMTCHQYLSLQHMSTGCIPLFIVCFLTSATTLDAAALNRTHTQLPTDQLRPNDVRKDAHESEVSLVNSLSGYVTCSFNILLCVSLRHKFDDLQMSYDIILLNAQNSHA